MNLLLLLSALLSALTGAASSVREPTAAHAIAGAAAAIQAETVRESQQVARRPILALPDLRAIAVAVAPLAVAPSAPLYASRRRE